MRAMANSVLSNLKELKIKQALIAFYDDYSTKDIREFANEIIVSNYEQNMKHKPDGSPAETDAIKEFTFFVHKDIDEKDVIYYGILANGSILGKNISN